jgi:hypothetical protein
VAGRSAPLFVERANAKDVDGLVILEGNEERSGRKLLLLNGGMEAPVE